MTKEEFVRLMTTDLPEAPAYFPAMRRSIASALNCFSLFRVRLLFRQDIQRLSVTGYVVLDVRSAADFGAGHIPGAINIGLGGQFALWAGSLIALSASLIIVAESTEQVDEAVTRLARVGIENVKGYLDGGMLSWNKAALDVSTVPQISVDDLNHLLEEEKEPLQVLDVRRPPEYQSGHVPRALSVPLSVLREHISDLALDPAKATAVICAGGYRSSAATSLLEQKGFRDLRNVIGGTTAWINAGLNVEMADQTVREGK